MEWDLRKKKFYSRRQEMSRTNISIKGNMNSTNAPAGRSSTSTNNELKKKKSLFSCRPFFWHERNTVSKLIKIFSSGFT